MDEGIQDGSEVHETTETEAEAVETTEAEESETLSKEEIAELRKKAESSSQNFERLKKAEEELKKLRKGTVGETLSVRDGIVLANAKIHEEDLDQVLEWAKFKKVDVATALKDPTLKTILSTRAEERQTAEATTVRSARGSSKPSGEDVLRKAEMTGEVPETEEGLRALQEARLARRRK